MSREEVEILQKQEEWDNMLASMENQEAELHNGHLRLLREQSTVFIQELEIVRAEVSGLRSALGEMRGLLGHEAAVRKEANSRVEERLFAELERVFGEQAQLRQEVELELAAQRDVFSQEVKSSHGSLGGRLEGLAAELIDLASERLGGLQGDLQELREVVGGERLAREAHQSMIQESLQTVHAQTKLEEIQQLVLQERNARDMLRTYFLKRFDAEKLARDAHNTFVEDRLKFLGDLINETTKRQSREWEAKLQEHLCNIERATVESVHLQSQTLAVAHAKVEQVHAPISICKGHGDKVSGVHNVQTDLADFAKQPEEAVGSLTERMDHIETMIGEAREALEGLRSHEGGNLSEQCRAIGDSVRVLQRSMATCESMVRKEIEQRCKEIKCIWDVINVQMHDPSPERTPASSEKKKQASEVEVADATDSYVPFPCQPLTSFLRLGGQGSMEEERRKIRRFVRGASPGLDAAPPSTSSSPLRRFR